MNECHNCQHWTPLQPDDETAPEGKCGLTNNPGFFPFGYWPSTLGKDGCGDGYAPLTEV